MPKEWANIEVKDEAGQRAEFIQKVVRPMNARAGTTCRYRPSGA